MSGAAYNLSVYLFRRAQLSSRAFVIFVMASGQTGYKQSLWQTSFSNDGISSGEAILNL